MRAWRALRAVGYAVLVPSLLVAACPSPETRIRTTAIALGIAVAAGVVAAWASSHLGNRRMRCR